MLQPSHSSLQVATVPPQRVPVRDRDQDAPWHTEAVCRRDEAGLFFVARGPGAVIRAARGDGVSLGAVREAGAELLIEERFQPATLLTDDIRVV